jgi:hypothetical protein
LIYAAADIFDLLGGGGRISLLLKGLIGLFSSAARGNL